MANFRPISQLPFVSKILEKVVARRIAGHIHDHELFDPFQSAYRSEHSTESALLQIQRDNYCETLIIQWQELSMSCGRDSGSNLTTS